MTEIERLRARVAFLERAARNWKLAAQALRTLAIMAGVRKSFYQPFSLRRWK